MTPPAGSLMTSGSRHSMHFDNRSAPVDNNNMIMYDMGLVSSVIRNGYKR